jgi:hypothetical protein
VLETAEQSGSRSFVDLLKARRLEPFPEDGLVSRAGWHIGMGLEHRNVAAVLDCLADSQPIIPGLPLAQPMPGRLSLRDDISVVLDNRSFARLRLYEIVLKHLSTFDHFTVLEVLNGGLGFEPTEAAAFFSPIFARLTTAPRIGGGFLRITFERR